MFGYLKYMYIVLLKLIKPDVWILDGDEKSTNKPLNILYIGAEKDKNYMTRTVFNDLFYETYLGKKFFWQLYYILNKNRYKCALTIIEGTFLERYLYWSMKDFFVPLWVDSTTDLPLIINNRSSKNDLRRVRKNKLEYIVTRDTEMLHDFYYNMHRPMIRTRYQTGAFEITYDGMMEKMKDECYELLLIKKQDIFISGVVVKRCEGIPRLWKNGIRDIKYWENGAIVATYVFASDYLYKKGYKKVSFGTMRGFLNDGLLQHKKKWNVTLKISGERGYILKPLIVSDAVKGFFENNPFIYRQKDKLYGAIFINKEDCSEEEYKVFQKKYYFEGFSGFNVFSIRENGTIQKVACVNKS